MLALRTEKDVTSLRGAHSPNGAVVPLSAVARALLTLDHGLGMGKALGFCFLGIASRGAAN